MMSARESQPIYGQALMFALEHHANLTKHGEQGTTAFLNLQSPISDEDCNKLVTEVLANTMSKVPYNTDTIKLIHDVLREPVDGQDNTRLGDSLDRSGVGFFLKHCHLVLDTKTSGEFFKDGVKKVLHWTKMNVDNSVKRLDSKPFSEKAAYFASIDPAVLRTTLGQIRQMRKMIEEMSENQHHSVEQLEQILRDRQTRMEAMLDDERKLRDRLANIHE